MTAELMTAELIPTFTYKDPVDPGPLAFRLSHSKCTVHSRAEFVIGF